ncbi:enoyl-CoA hydratase/isomerase family protein [Pigmentiphaga litoralis]|uniref:enoyl-CoA hydratase/isomerase family protein n=1 Tax=Pigmentiphaga litoralis TaxID=516702 RepID=UPI003B436A34
MTDVLTVSRNGDECHVLLNRPAAGNALNADMVGALLEVLDARCSDGTQRLTLEGAGRHFCTGFDLSDVLAMTRKHDAEPNDGDARHADDCLLGRFARIERLLQALADTPFQTIARVHGRATGAGADLLTACTRRELTSDAIVSFPGASGFGLVLGTRRLAARVGPAIAREWVTSGRSITAAEALAAGLATTVTGPPAPPPADASPQRELDAYTAALIDDALHDDIGMEAWADLTQTRRRANDKDLALLVASAARPGLARRIAGYMGSISAFRRQQVPTQ